MALIRCVGLAAMMLCVAAQTPPATPRPPLTPLAFPPSPDAAFCTTASRSAIETTIGANLNKITAAEKLFEAENKALFEWKADRLVAAGAWTEDSRRLFLAKLLADPVIEEGRRAKVAGFQNMMAKVASLEGAEKAGDHRRVCALYLDMLDATTGMARQNDKVWRHTHDATDEVARQGGVSFD